jgi:hypothetical protein
MPPESNVEGPEVPEILDDDPAESQSMRPVFRLFFRHTGSEGEQGYGNTM